ncbi:MAG: hypothetical protein ACOCV1_02510 [Bacillota bacterium]
MSDERKDVIFHLGKHPCYLMMENNKDAIVLFGKSYNSSDGCVLGLFYSIINKSILLDLEEIEKKGIQLGIYKSKSERFKPEKFKISDCQRYIKSRYRVILRNMFRYQYSPKDFLNYLENNI